ncbi:MAG: hypothetical protein ACOCU0_01445 [Bacillota bacterium]
MKNQEHRIVTKIIRDLCLLMLESGHPDFDVNVLEHSHQCVIVLKAMDIKDSVIRQIHNHLSSKRAFEVETYGFELLGDFDAQNELELLGSLVDDVEIIKCHDETTIRIVRKNLYNA